MPPEFHFGCTQCGACCRNTRIPLTVVEAVAWLERGHVVQLLCEASPWSAALDNDSRAAHFKRRSFPVMSGDVPTRVVLVFVGYVNGPCPNLLPDMRCGIYADRPLACRIYPAEVNPFIAFNPANKICPPEAWAHEQPLLRRGEEWVDEALRRDIEASRGADVEDVALKSRLCAALNIVDTAPVHEAMLVYSPTVQELIAGLTMALARGTDEVAPLNWRFVSEHEETVAKIAGEGGSAVLKRDLGAVPFELFDLRRPAVFTANGSR